MVADGKRATANAAPKAREESSAVNASEREASDGQAQKPHWQPERPGPGVLDARKESSEPPPKTAPGSRSGARSEDSGQEPEPRRKMRAPFALESDRPQQHRGTWLMFFSGRNLHTGCSHAIFHAIFIAFF